MKCIRGETPVLESILISELTDLIQFAAVFGRQSAYDQPVCAVQMRDICTDEEAVKPQMILESPNLTKVASLVALDIS